MKSLFLIIPIAMLVSSQAFAQSITYKEMIGPWDKFDTTTQKLSFKFIDSSKLIIQDPTATFNNFNYKLITDSIKGKNIILIKNNIDGINHSNYYSIEQINKNTLKLINLDSYDPIVINPSQINKGIVYLIKRP